MKFIVRIKQEHTFEYEISAKLPAEAMQKALDKHTAMSEADRLDYEITRPVIGHPYIRPL